MELIGFLGWEGLGYYTPLKEKALFWALRGERPLEEPPFSLELSPGRGVGLGVTKVVG